MEYFTHGLIFTVSIFIVWFFAGILIASISRVARHLHRSGFGIAFFVLGLLTSISEISVALNSSIDGVPQVSAGNLIGSSFVLLLFLVPLLAIVGNGIKLANTLSTTSLGLALLVILFPVLTAVDGSISLREGILMLLMYLALAAFMRRDSKMKAPLVEKTVESLEEDIVQKRRPDLLDAIKIIVGGAAIFYAAHLLVEEAIYFADVFHAPPSLIGLLLLSIGTNVPEIVVAVRSVLKHQKAIAFGNYMGSAVANTLIFGFLPVLNGRFDLYLDDFSIIALLLFVGLLFFLFFATSRHRISRVEGVLLMIFYAAFLGLQLTRFIQCVTCAI